MSLQNDFNLKIAQLTGIALSGFTSGFIASISLLSVPALVLPSIPPTLATQEWQLIYDIGKKIGPSLGIVAGGAYAYLAFASKGNTRIAYGAAAVFTILHVPYTGAVMLATNNKLYAHAEGKVKGLADTEVRGLLRTWGAMNLGRSVFPAIGTGIALATALGLL